MASYYPSNLSPRMSSPRSTSVKQDSLRSSIRSDSLSLSPRTSEVLSLSPRAETLSLSPRAETLSLSPRNETLSLSPRAETLSLSPRSPRAGSRNDLLQRTSKSSVLKHLVHDKIKSNDWNLIVDDVLSHLKHHGVTTKLINSLKEHNWEVLHNVLKRALLISTIRMEVSNVLGVFVLLDNLKDKHHEADEAVQEFKRKVKEHIVDDKLLEELREWL